MSDEHVLRDTPAYSLKPLPPVELIPEPIGYWLAHDVEHDVAARLDMGAAHGTNRRFGAA